MTPPCGVPFSGLHSLSSSRIGAYRNDFISRIIFPSIPAWPHSEAVYRAG
jgi:hypothetical protein